MSTTGESPQMRRGRRRWYQFGLRAMLLITAMIAVLVAWQKPRIERWLESLRDKPASSDSILIIKIDADGSVVCGRSLEKDEFKLFLAREIEIAQRLRQEKPTLFIMAEGAAPMESVRGVTEIAHQAGFKTELHPYTE